MNFGSLWMKELSNLLNEGLSYREIARRLNVDPNTVIKYAKTVGSSKVIAVQNIDRVDLLESNRKTWLQLQQNNSNLSKTELRKQNPGTYAFLYRNDREWLDDNSPTLQQIISENKRVNWEKRDQEILSNVKKVTRELKARNGKLNRITVKSIGDAVGERALLEQHLDKMPKTKAFINEVKESDQEFRLRRVQHVIEEMHEAGEVIKTWKVLRKANIKAEFSNEVTGYIGQFEDEM